MTLKNKTAIVTGASSGIGVAIAKKLASEGCALVLVARKEEALIQSAKQIKQKFKVRVKCYVCDMTHGEEILNLTKKIKKDFSSVNILINNAGGSHITEPTDVLDTAFDKDIALNLRGTHLCCRLLSEIIQKGGAIVNVSSLNGQTIISSSHGKNMIKIGYAAAKAGVIQLTKAYAWELAERGIRVNAVAPGAIYPTGMTGDWDKEKQLKIKREVPLKRLGKPEDAANAVYFLVSDLSSFITGHTLDVNGGRYMN